MRHAVLIFACLAVGMPCLATAQFEGIKITFYRSGAEDVKVAGKFTLTEPLDDPVEFEFKGGEKNVWSKISWAKPLNANVEAKVLILDDKGSYSDGLDPKFLPKGLTEIVYPFTITQGSYTLQLVDKNDQSKVFVERKFTVVDKIGDRATGNQKAGEADFWICQKIDDDWNPVNPAAAEGDPKKKVFTWAAGKPFEALIRNKDKKPFGSSFLGIVIHKQGEDGKDTDFVTELQTDNLKDTQYRWGTEGGLPDVTSLPAGRYTIYVIDWANRQPTEHTGNLKKFFSRITLIVK